MALSTGGGIELNQQQLTQLRLLLERAAKQKVPVSYTFRVNGLEDPLASLLAIRAGDEPVYCLQQPDNGGRVVAGLGEVFQLQAQGRARFSTVAQLWREHVRSTLQESCPQSSPTLRAVGGFGFADNACSTPRWSAFKPARLWVPELLFIGDETGLTLTVSANVVTQPQELLEHLQRRLMQIQNTALPLLDPDPAVTTKRASTMPPEHFEHAVLSAVERIKAGEIEKIVLAREVQAHAAANFDAGAVFGVLRESFPSCFNYFVALADKTFVGASPELLLRRKGQRVSTVALAGSARRSADPAIDRHLAESLLSSGKDRNEHAVVIERITRSLDPFAVWVTAAPEPQIAKVANVQHLATPIRAQLSDNTGSIELVGVLHPTPAIGGEPKQRALELIPALEGLERGWYAGAVGWVDASDDGEFSVALRCALLDGAVAHCYAGVGVVEQSNPSDELAETETKLEAILPVVT